MPLRISPRKPVVPKSVVYSQYIGGIVIVWFLCDSSILHSIMAFILLVLLLISHIVFSWYEYALLEYRTFVLEYRVYRPAMRRIEYYINSIESVEWDGDKLVIRGTILKVVGTSHCKDKNKVVIMDADAEVEQYIYGYLDKY